MNLFSNFCQGLKFITKDKGIYIGLSARKLNKMQNYLDLQKREDFSQEKFR